MQLLDIHGKSSTAKVGPDLLMLGAHAHTRVQLLLLTSAMMQDTGHTAAEAIELCSSVHRYGICQEWVVQRSLWARALAATTRANVACPQDMHEIQPLLIFITGMSATVVCLLQVLHDAVDGSPAHHRRPHPLLRHSCGNKEAGKADAQRYALAEGCSGVRTILPRCRPLLG